MMPADALDTLRGFDGVDSPLRGAEAGSVSSTTPSSWPAPVADGSPPRRSPTASCIRSRSGRDRAGASRAVPDVEWDHEHIDALAAKFVLDPARFDVVVGSNLFGDILSDLAAAVAGSIGIAPSANLDPTHTYP